MRSYVGVGLLILSLAFPVAFFGSFGVTISLGELGIVIALETNPQRYVDYVQEAFSFMVLPPAVGLAVSLIAFVKEIKRPTGVFDKLWLHLAVFGGFFFFWGAYGFLWTSKNYEAVGDYAYYFMTSHYPSVDIREPLQAVYNMVFLAYILWIFAGILYLSPAFNKIFNRILGER